MSRFLSSRYKKIKPYTPGEQPIPTQADKIAACFGNVAPQQIITKLNTNESPFPPSSEIINAVKVGELMRLNLYPDPETKEVVNSIASYLKVPSSHIIMGNGSDEILAFTFQAFCDKNHQPCFADITYGFYSVFCELYGLNPEIIPLKDDFTIDPTDYYNKTGPIFIANPNAPTGLALTCEQIEDILIHNQNNIVLIDEAYVDFGAKSAIKLIDDYDNLIISRTFSKSRNLAGARLGYAISNKSVIEDLNKMKFSFNPYNVNRISLVAGAASMRDTSYFNECISKIKSNREWTVKELKKRFFKMTDSKANFIFAKHETMSGAEYYERLKEKGIYVRHFSGNRIDDYVRITIGSDEDMKRLIKYTDIILKERKDDNLYENLQYRTQYSGNKD